MLAEEPRWSVGAVSGYEHVGSAGWLGKAKPGHAGHHDAARVIQRDAMSDAHVEGLDMWAGPEDGTDNLMIVKKMHGSPGGGGWIVMLAAQPTLGAPDGRSIEQQADMAGQAESTGMGHALSIEEEDVWFLPESANGGQGGWGLAKAQ